VHPISNLIELGTPSQPFEGKESVEKHEKREKRRSVKAFYKEKG
jgi:hypothetical protein